MASQSTLAVEETEHHDEVTLNWIIPNFKKLYDAAKSNRTQRFVEETFDIGGQKWGFQLHREKEEDVGIHLHFFGTDCVSVDFNVYMKSSEGKFIKTLHYFELFGLKKFTPNKENVIEGVSECWRHPGWTTLSDLQNNGFLSDFTLHLKLIVSVYSGKAHLKMKTLKNFKSGLDSSEGTDVTFVFEEDEEGSQNKIEKIKAHRAILSLQSPVFATMFGSGMTEATNGEVKIEDMSPKAMRILLNFMYSGELDLEWGDVAEELIYGADKYDLEEFKAYLCENIDPVITVKNVMKIRHLGILYRLHEVVTSTMKFIKENAEEFFQHHEVIFKST